MERYLKVEVSAAMHATCQPTTITAQLRTVTQGAPPKRKAMQAPTRRSSPNGNAHRVFKNSC